MQVLRAVNDIELNKGDGMANGLFNLSSKKGLSLWFDIETKKMLMKLPNAYFLIEAKYIIKKSTID